MSDRATLTRPDPSRVLPGTDLFLGVTPPPRSLAASRRAAATREWTLLRTNVNSVYAQGAV